jgi:hypothetical protein
LKHKAMVIKMLSYVKTARARFSSRRMVASQASSKPSISIANSASSRTDLINMKDLSVKHCPTEETVGVFFAKPLQGKLFFKF